MRLHSFVAAFFLLLFCLIPLVSFGQPSISGDLTGTLGPGEYIVVGDCQVPAGQVLDILPGTTLLFSGHYTFKVYGQLNAIGTESDSILFVRQYPNENCRHGGVRFYGQSTFRSTLSYCLIDNANNQNYPNWYGGGIFSDHYNVIVTHCRITNCYAYNGGGGLYSTDSSVQIQDCVFMDNISSNGGGVYLNNSSNSTIENSIFARNSSTST